MELVMDWLPDIALEEMLGIAYATFLANFAFGLLVKMHAIRTRRFRFVHHLLYALVMGTIVAATVVAVARASWPAALWPGIMALLLFAMPAFRGAGRAHSIFATLCLLLYTGIAVPIVPLARFASGLIHAAPAEPGAGGTSGNALKACRIRRARHSVPDATNDSCPPLRIAPQWNYLTPFAADARRTRDSWTSP
ncbi:MAG TPA: hypothetical protein VHI13_05070 [Candidatus Kapabacteria bacterium]|nr:hypothetical protein [Candidatus Kapabacteria bacterium]